MGAISSWCRPRSICGWPAPANGRRTRLCAPPGREPRRARAPLRRPGRSCCRRPSEEKIMSQLVLLLAAVTAATLVPSASQAQQRTWFGCGDQIVYESGVALGQSRIVEAGAGHTVWRTACQADGRRFEIRRTKAGCSWVPDPAHGVARREEREVYRDAAGEEIEVKPCSLRDGAETVPLRLTVSGCRMRNDFEDGVTMGESRAVFSPPEDGGGAAPRLAQACAERRDAPLVWKAPRGDVHPAEGECRGRRSGAELDASDRRVRSAAGHPVLPAARRRNAAHHDGGMCGGVCSRSGKRHLLRHPPLVSGDGVRGGRGNLRWLGHPLRPESGRGLPAPDRQHRLAP
ncbi:protein of unknown function (plasmid) [Azospirillum baldaniorum]|uniref:Uncharacterized protein n=1 Tax=Azospirillum baldaniorum TaxID=1064539 RepID=A0A9P1NSH1_9PROT|nr:protein of unknown function [Azospirillum baldaniorum]